GTVRLTRGVQAEEIGLGLLDASARVEDGRHHEEIHGKQKHQDRQAGQVADTAHTPRHAPAAHSAVERHPQEGEAQHDEEPEERNPLVVVVQDIVAHLVTHYGLDLRQAATLEQIVVQCDPGGPHDPADVGADPGGLARGVHDVDVVHRN